LRSIYDLFCVAVSGSQRARILPSKDRPSDSFSIAFGMRARQKPRFSLWVLAALRRTTAIAAMFQTQVNLFQRAY
jgi:hypothetical protein